MTSDEIHALFIVGTAAVSGYEISKGNYGWGVTFGLLFFAVLKY